MPDSTTNLAPSSGDSVDRMIADLSNPLKFRAYLLKSLPSCLWWGIGVKHLTRETCQITIPYNYRTKNPFNSIYFAAMCGAGEFATGALCKLALGEGRDVSMLVVNQESEFTKKAISEVTFTCEQGREVAEVVSRARATGAPQTCRMTAVGKMADGTRVGSVTITWSFLLRKQRKK